MSRVAADPALGLPGPRRHLCARRRHLLGPGAGPEARLSIRGAALLDARTAAHHAAVGFGHVSHPVQPLAFSLACFSFFFPPLLPIVATFFFFFMIRWWPAGVAPSTQPPRESRDSVGVFAAANGVVMAFWQAKRKKKVTMHYDEPISFFTIHVHTGRRCNDRRQTLGSNQTPNPRS